MNTRCKPGDLAIITRDEPGCEGNIGRMVLVSGPPVFTVDQGLTWIITPTTLEPWLYIDICGTLKFADYEQGDIEHPDAWMTPFKLDTELESEDDLSEVGA